MFDLLGGVQAIQLRHADVENDDVGIQRGCDLHQGPAIGNDSHHLKLGLQQTLAGLCHQLVIVGNQ